MNDWGKKNIPFIFIIDFEIQKPLLFKLDDINENELLYNLNGICNDSHIDYPEKNVIFVKGAIPGARNGFVFVTKQA